ncbi:STAS domain-containing protein [Streptomyces sp. NBC_00829]|uniref:STAS domain-containing protein n=1 Tax=Streptomyces sp. NBC_00829 TaxID=2903679 RepID=UPI00386BB279|nr:STAS domain-containing protein [Streptomyces sp. NBC_00829]
MPHTPHKPPRRWSRFLHRTFLAQRTTVVRLQGQIDLRTAERTTRMLLDGLRGLPDILEADLSDVDHLSRDGTMVFLIAREHARTRRTRLIVTNASPQAVEMLGRAGLRGILAAGGGHNAGS